MKNKTLVSQTIDTVFSTTVKEKTNYLIYVDRSGSMSWTLPKLIDDLANQLEKFEKGSTVSIAWFSGRNQYGWVCKGTDISHKDEIRRMLQNYKHSVGMTLFSQVLEDTKNVLRDLSAISKKFTLLLFTDGCVTDRGYSEELRDVTRMLQEYSEHIGFSMMVGYGEYYDRNFLLSMSAALGGICVHSNNLEQVSDHFITFAQDSSKGNSLKAKLELKNTPYRDVVFSVDGNNVSIYKPENNTVLVPQTVQEIFYLTEDKKFKPHVVSSEKNQSLAYAAARVMSQVGDVQTALDIVGELGDVNFVDGLNNAFTNAEYGKVEEMLGFAAASATYRFVKGKNLSYLPKDDEFCVLDLFEFLQKENAQFLPFNPQFNYNRVGKSAKPKEGFAKLEFDKTQSVPMSHFTWNKSKLNLSVLAKMNGTVNLGEEAEKHGLQQNFPTFSYRNYTLIKDGKPNVLQIPIVYEDKFVSLMEKGIATKGELANTLVIDLSLIPVINRNIAKNYTSAKILAQNTLREKRLEVCQKYIKYQISLLEDVSVKNDYLTDAQVEFLESRGIGKNGYAPPTETEEAIDFYYAKEFEIVVDGYKTIPKIEDFIEKYQAGIKKPTPVQNELIEIHEKFVKEALNLSEVKRLAWLNEQLVEIKMELSALRAYSARAKFAIILAKQQFDEIEKLEENTEVVFDGIKYTFKLKNVEVKY